jgi:hypothetical protein
MRPPSPVDPRAAACALAILLSLAACGGPATSPVAPTPTPGPSVQFAFQGSDPVVTRQLTELDELFINPGAVIEHAGELHMFANVFSAWPGTVHVPHLTSSDGVSWTLASDQPAFTAEDVPFAGGDGIEIDVSTGFVGEDGTWVLIFETVQRGDPWVLGRATAPGPDGPWTVDPEPIVEPGPDGSWDRGGLSWPSVVRLGTEYRLYYTASEIQFGDGVIGMATSTDGVTWVKHAEPVLEPSAEWERGSVDRPRVARVGDGLVMVYAGGLLTSRGVAWSDDGISWHRDGQEAAITRDDFPTSGSAWDAALVKLDGALLYYLEIGSSGSSGTQVYLATADLP